MTICDAYDRRIRSLRFGSFAEADYGYETRQAESEDTVEAGLRGGGDSDNPVGISRVGINL